MNRMCLLAWDAPGQGANMVGFIVSPFFYMKPLLGVLKRSPFWAWGGALLLCLLIKDAGRIGLEVHT